MLAGPLLPPFFLYPRHFVKQFMTCSPFIYLQLRAGIIMDFSQLGFGPEDINVQLLNNSASDEAIQAMEWNSKASNHSFLGCSHPFLITNPVSKAVEAAKSGDNKTAEKWHRKALNAKINAKLGWVTTAISHNGLGEALLELRKLDEAEEQLKAALALRAGQSGHTFDAAVSRENLAQVYQAMNKPHMARATREDGENIKEMCCSNETVRVSN